MMFFHAAADPHEPARYSGTFEEELRKGNGLPGVPEVYPVLELTLPDGPLFLGGVNSGARGPYLPRVVSFGSANYSVSLQSNELASAETSIEIIDTDRLFAKKVAKYRTSLIGSPGKVRWLSPNVPDADAHVDFLGVMAAPSQVRPHVWSIRLRSDDRPLEEGSIPRVPISAADFPNLDAATAQGQLAPVLYGIHDSSGLTKKGMVPALLVDTQAFRYVLSLGRLKRVRAVYKDGVLQATSAYTTPYYTVNGKVWTTVKFTASQGSSSITADVEGLTDRADGAGTLLAPAAVQQHILVNLVWNNWTGDAYFDPASAPVDLTTFAAADEFLTTLGYEISRRLGGPNPVNARAQLLEFLNDVEMKAWWTEGGRLAIGAIDHRLRDYQEFVAPLSERDLGSFGTQLEDTQGTVREIAARFIYGEVEQKFFAQIKVQDLSLTSKVSKNRDLPWSAARAL